MMKSAFIVFALIIIIGFTGSISFTNSKAVNVSHSSAISALGMWVHPDSLLLTKQKTKDWMQTRIAVAKLQKQMKQNASVYENVVQKFSAKRTDLLESKGWSTDEFDAVKNRIHAAVAAMDISEELEESRADHEKEVAEIKNNDFYSDEQKQELISALNKMREQKRAQIIEPTKPDWPAVRPYRAAFRQMTSWIAGNTTSVPVIK